jgi:hypothetical protein
VKKAQRDSRDRNNRGFEDEVSLINDTLDQFEEIVKYVDNHQLKFYRSPHHLQEIINQADPGERS